MPKRKKLLLALGLLLVFQLVGASAHSAFFDPKLKWYTISTKHFNIHFHQGEEDIARRMALISEKVYAELVPRWDWKPWGRTEVILTDTTDVSNAFTSTLPYNYILLFISAPQGDSTLNYYNDWLEDLFRHEFTHTVHLDMYGGIVKPFRWIFGRIITPNGITPGWIREGLAVQQESLDGKGRGHNSFSEMMLRTDVLNGEFLSLDQMAGLQFDWPSFNAAYIYGGMFWTWLADKYGQDTLVEFAHRYSNSMWLFSLNNKARKTYDNKNFFRLHKEWETFLTEKFTKQKAELEAQGLTPLTDVMHIKGNLDNPTLSPDGKTIIYNKSDVHNKPEIRKMNLDGSGDERVIKGRTGNQYSFSSDGKRVLYSAMGAYKHFYSYYDIHELDLTTKKVRQLTRGQRAFHPDYSPDGKKIVFVENKLASTQLYLYDVETKKATPLTDEKPFVQFSNPRFSPDGRQIAVSLWKDKNRDIYIFDLEGKVVKQVTQDTAIDLNPIFSKDGQDLFFTSDRSGVTNVYRYNFASGATQQVTNVLTGVFEPQYAGGTMLVKNYFGRGYDIKSLAYTPAPIEPPKTAAKPGRRGKKAPKESIDQISPIRPISSGTQAGGGTQAEAAAQPEPSPSLSEPLPDPELVGDLKIKKYNPFKKLFIPRYIMPGIFFGDSVLITMNLGSSDPIGRHVWTGGFSYRTDANFLGGNFLYTYNRFKPTLFVTFNDFVVNYGDLFRTGSNFFEERTRASIGASIGGGRHNLAGYYFFEHRSAETAIPPGVILPPTLGNFSGFGLRYTFTRVNKFPASISLEGGPRLTASLEVTDSALGSSPNNEQVIFSGDLREYVPLPLDGHVLAFRLAGGIAFGDSLLQGTFRLGSALGEGVLSGSTPRLYTLRGLPQITFAGERALLMSAEDRLPLVAPQRGAGTGPIHLEKLYMVFFGDYGSVFNGDIDFKNFLLGVGAELRADLIIAYGLPITTRLGYGIIVYGRQFIQGLTDPLLGIPVSNGTLILELGTSF